MTLQQYPCHLLENTDFVQVSLRRYTEGNCKHGYHEAQVPLHSKKFASDMSLFVDANGPIALNDHRWPTKCSHCDYVFREDDHKQYFTEHLFHRVDSNELLTLRAAQPGAMWFAEGFSLWYSKRVGADGHSLMVKLPGGSDWCVDDRASNCDSPCKNCGTPYLQHATNGCRVYADSQPNHKCWPRIGTAPNIDVQKRHGHTCNAGAGSIQAGGWHGFLRNGILRT